jgi:hypothetical protein
MTWKTQYHDSIAVTTQGPRNTHLCNNNLRANGETSKGSLDLSMADLISVGLSEVAATDYLSIPAGLNASTPHATPVLKAIQSMTPSGVRDQSCPRVVLQFSEKLAKIDFYVTLACR